MGVFVTGECGDGVERLFLIVEPAFESDGGEVDLLLNGVVQLRATQAPHVSEIERSSQHQRHGDAGSEKQQFASNTHIKILATKGTNVFLSVMCFLCLFVA